jgi:hypothetical protein
VLRPASTRCGGGVWVRVHCFGIDELFVVDMHRASLQPQTGDAITTLRRHQEALPGCSSAHTSQPSDSLDRTRVAFVASHWDIAPRAGTRSESGAT